MVSAQEDVVVQSLRRSITRLSLRLRSVADRQRPAEPRFVAYDTLRLANGQLVGRKKVIVMSSGCSVPTCTMCPFANENNYGREQSPDELLEQVRQTLERTEDEPAYEVLSLYNDGSLFAPKEVPREIQVEVARLVAASGVRRLVVESLPPFITERVLKPFVEALGAVQLEIGIARS